MSVEIVELQPGETHPVRLAVLRADAPSKLVVFDGDELATTFHLGVRQAGALVAVSTWLAVPYPDRPAQRGVQLRGMATLAGFQGTGVGSRLLTAGFDRCRATGVDLVWARARDAALGFYERHGFVVVGAGYTDLTTQLPHHDIVRMLE